MDFDFSLEKITPDNTSILTVSGALVTTTSLSTSLTTSISAAGTNQGSATSLTSDYNVISTVGSGQGVILPVTSSPYGRSVTVINNGANALLVYPPSSGTIDSAATNTPVTLPISGQLTVFSASSTAWLTSKPSLVAGSGVSVAYGNGQITVSSSSSASFPITVVSGTTVTAVAGNQYMLENAGTTTVTMPATASQGDTVLITSANGRTDNIIVPNGNNIGGQSANMILNIAYYTVGLLFDYRCRVCLGVNTPFRAILGQETCPWHYFLAWNHVSPFVTRNGI